MTKEGEGFENLTELIFKKLAASSQFDSVEKNVQIDGKDGKRQIDVLLKTTSAGFELITIIECKDHGLKVSVGEVDKLHSKMQDINANKGILVSRKGFSSMSIGKAKRLGISLCTAHEALNPKWEIDLEFPIIITEVHPVGFKPSGRIRVGNNSTQIAKNSIMVINDQNVSDLFSDYWKQGKVLHELIEKEQAFAPKEIAPPYYIRDTSNNKIWMENFKMLFTLKITSYFGYLNKQKNTQLLKNITEGTDTLFFDSSLLINYKNIFKKLKKDQIPKFKTLNLEVRAYPEISVHNTDVSFEKID